MSMYIGTVSVYVTDQDIAADFYTNKLGFVKHVDEDLGDGNRWLQVAPAGGQASIVLTRGVGNWSREQGGVFPGIVIHTDNLDAAYNELSGRGVPFIEPPTMQPWGMMQAMFQDPDGNMFMMVELPPMGEAGH